MSSTVVLGSRIQVQLNNAEFAKKSYTQLTQMYPEIETEESLKPFKEFMQAKQAECLGLAQNLKQEIKNIQESCEHEPEMAPEGFRVCKKCGKLMLD